MASITIVNSAFPSRRPYFPIGSLIVAASIEHAGYRVNFRDYQLATGENYASPTAFAKFLVECGSEIVGITVFANTLPTVLLSIQLLKERSPDVKVVLGGPGVSGLSERIMALSPVDVVARGEGEYTAPRVVRAFLGNEEFSSISGITYRQGWDVISNPDSPRAKNLDLLPFPGYNLVNLVDYGNEVGIITSRGCPYQCSFCAKPIWEHGVSFRTIPNVISELSALKGTIRKLYISDDSFVSVRERVLQFCSDYLGSGIATEWECTGRVGLVDDTLLSLMAAAGCTDIFFGIESGSNRILSRISKKFVIEDAKRDLLLASQKIRRVHVSFIWGFPFEDLDDFQRTIYFILENTARNPFNPVMTLATPFISSPLYNEFKDRLVFLPDNHYNGSTLGRGETLEKYPEMLDFVKRHPDVFPSFFYFDHADFGKKRDIVDRIIANQKIGEGSRHGGRDNR